MENQFCHLELNTYNVKGAEEFYGRVFDWKPAEPPEAVEARAKMDTGSRETGVAVSKPERGMPAAWTVYIQTDDVDQACQRVVAAGGNIWKAPTDLPGVGRFAIACDPQGAYFGLWTSFGRKNRRAAVASGMPQAAPAFRA